MYTKQFLLTNVFSNFINHIKLKIEVIELKILIIN